MTVRLLLLAVFSLTLSPLHALEFRLLSWSGDITDLFYSQGGKSVSVTASETTVSPLYTWQGSDKLVFYRERRQEDRTIRDTVLTVDAPPDLAKAILLLSLDPSNPANNTGQWIDDTPSGIPADAVTYLNLSSHRVGIQLGQETSTVAAKDSKTFRLDNKRRLLTLKVAAQNQSGWQVVASSSLGTYPGRRTLMILRDGRPQPNGLKDVIEMLRFDDYPTSADTTP
jgi:hypothetical protein